ncbi:DUF4287 domain-containing protein [Roseomonas sp. BN140053]|uniref:DUF4287 domain-containing protein n=1 Tax=Roseomonas sp. BN140053 TaxID=3391898 RepID=UPI0039EB9DDB
MADGPTQGPASSFPAIEKKHGRPIAAWQALIHRHLPARHMEVVALLKHGHGMGHGHANALVAQVLAAGKDRTALPG